MFIRDQYSHLAVKVPNCNVKWEGAYFGQMFEKTSGCVDDDEEDGDGHDGGQLSSAADSHLMDDFFSHLLPKPSTYFYARLI